MAVDTADERYSLISMCLPFGRTLHVPDGTIGGDDRQFFLLLYVGILFGEPVVVVMPHAGIPKPREAPPPPFTALPVFDVEWFERQLAAQATRDLVYLSQIAKKNLDAEEEEIKQKARETEEMAEYYEDEVLAVIRQKQMFVQNEMKNLRALATKPQLRKARAAQKKKRTQEKSKATKLRNQRLKNLEKARAAKKSKRKKKK